MSQSTSTVAPATTTAIANANSATELQAAAAADPVVAADLANLFGSWLTTKGAAAFGAAVGALAAHYSVALDPTLAAAIGAVLAGALAEGVKWMSRRAGS